MSRRTPKSLTTGTGVNSLSSSVVLNDDSFCKSCGTLTAKTLAQLETRKSSAKVVLPEDWFKVVRDTNLRKPFQVNCCPMLFVLYS